MSNNFLNSFSKVKSLTLLVGFIIITFFTSCTVRKAIQFQLDIPITKQLNPSKALLTSVEVCENLEQKSFILPLKTVGVELSNTALPTFSKTALTHSIKKVVSFLFLTNKAVNSEKIPFYILYLNLKLKV